MAVLETVSGERGPPFLALWWHRSASAPHCRGHLPANIQIATAPGHCDRSRSGPSPSAETTTCPGRRRVEREGGKVCKGESEEHHAQNVAQAVASKTGIVQPDRSGGGTGGKEPGGGTLVYVRSADFVPSNTACRCFCTLIRSACSRNRVSTWRAPSISIEGSIFRWTSRSTSSRSIWNS